MKLEIYLPSLIIGALISLKFTIGQPRQMSEAKSNPCFVDSIAPDPCNDYVIRFYEDTLFQTPAASMAYLPDPNSLIQKLPFGNGFVGVIVGYHYDDFIATYRCDSNGRWQREFCGKGVGGEDFVVTMPDLNFDGHPDLLIDGNYGGIRGNHFAICFLFDPRHKTFQRFPALDLENLAMDEYKRQFRSVHYGSKYGACIKQLYAWQQDSIVLLEEALYHADSDSAYIAFKSRQADGVIQSNTIRGLTEPLWHFFVDFALWEGF